MKQNLIALCMGAAIVNIPSIFSNSMFHILC